jgi:sigma-B regulation protein RsbU (phosphoserine phosphatase)
MNSLRSILPDFLHELSKAKDEYEACVIFADAICSADSTLAFEVLLRDSDFGLHSIIQKGHSIGGEYDVMYLNHGGILHGEIHYSTFGLNPEQIQLLSIMNAITSLMLSTMKNRNMASNSSRNLGRTSLLMTTIMEMLSDIILQSTPKGIADIGGQFLMGQLMVGTYGVLVNRKDGTKDFISSNGISHEKKLYILSQIDTDLEYSTIDELTCIGMIHGGHSHGALILGPQSNLRSYSDDDIYFVSILGMVIAVSLERARLHAEEQKLTQLQKEMEIAAIVQSNLFPSFDKQYSHCEISGIHIPSLEIGGDYMDVIPYPDGSLALIMADVSGKGIGSAMIMSMVKSACTLLVKQEKLPEDIIREMNDLIYEHTASDIFVTCIFIKMNADRSSFISINAGHETPLLKRSNGSIIGLEKGCMVLGVLKELHNIESEFFSIDCGDMLCLYTDGVQDSSLSENELLKEKLSQISWSDELSAHELLSKVGIVESVEQSNNVVDDKTLLLFRVI